MKRNRNEAPRRAASRIVRAYGSPRNMRGFRQARRSNPTAPEKAAIYIVQRYLHTDECLSDEQLAGILGYSVSTVERAKRWLREDFGIEFEYDPVGRCSHVGPRQSWPIDDLTLAELEDMGALPPWLAEIYDLVAQMYHRVEVEDPRRRKKLKKRLLN